MKVAVASGYACSTSWWARLQDEGADVKVWIDSPDGDELAHVGDGIVPKEENYDRFIEWAKEGSRTGEPTIVLFDASGMGEKADEARKAGLYVVGGGTFCDKLENDRQFGQDIAEEVGCQLPEFEAFKSLSEAQKWAEDQGEQKLFFKSDDYINADATQGRENGDDMAEYLDFLRGEYKDKCRCIIQHGCGEEDLSTARWWNGRSWIGPYQLTLEKKKFMDDDFGPSTGCSLNVVWYADEPRSAKELKWDALTQHFLANEAPPGLYDINARVGKDGEMYFLEWTPRLGYDSEMTSFRLIDNLSDFLWMVATGQGATDFWSDLAYSVRMSLSSYPWEHARYADKYSCLDTPIRGTEGLWDGSFIAYQVAENEKFGLHMASTEGIVGLAFAAGHDLSKLAEETVEYGKMLRTKIAGLQMRSDGGKVLREVAQKLADCQHPVHPGLLR